jgi:GNAT superfamily N-acetyltransferase
MPYTLRPATDADTDAVAALWRAAWRDGHLGHVSEELVAIRTPESFRERSAVRIPRTAVAVDGDGGIAGFVTTEADEVEQVFVGAGHRGTGVAGLLLTEGERRVAAAGHPRAWLAVVDGNTRARRFYERRGWVDEGAYLHRADAPDGTIEVPCRRYVKPV